MPEMTKLDAETEIRKFRERAEKCFADIGFPFTADDAVRGLLESVPPVHEGRRMVHVCFQLHNNDLPQE